MSEPTVTYTWRIERLDCAPSQDELTNVVCKIHWRLFATDGINTLDLYGDIPLHSPDPETFLAYDELSEATVIGWLESAIDERAGEEEPTVAQMETGLSGMLAAKRAPSVVPMPFPW